MIDFVQSFSHLGCLITSDSDDGEDITIRKHSFIGQVNNALCYFGILSSSVKYNLFHAYCTSYYGLRGFPEGPYYDSGQLTFFIRHVI